MRQNGAFNHFPKSKHKLSHLTAYQPAHKSILDVVQKSYAI